MIEHVARFPRGRDLALFVGNPTDIVGDAFGGGPPPHPGVDGGTPPLPWVRHGVRPRAAERPRGAPGHVHGADRLTAAVHLRAPPAALRAAVPRPPPAQEHGVGCRIDFADADLDALADAIAAELGRPVDIRRVERDGAARAAELV